MKDYYIIDEPSYLIGEEELTKYWDEQLLRYMFKSNREKYPSSWKPKFSFISWLGKVLLLGRRTRLESSDDY